MRYLSGDELTYLHARLIEASGGLPGARDETALQAIPTKVRMAQMGQEIFQDLYGKAANLMRLVVAGRPFYDGNKRVGFGAAVVFLSLNGQEFDATDHEIVDFCRAVERGSVDLSVIAEWFRSRTRPRL